MTLPWLCHDSTATLYDINMTLIWLYQEFTSTLHWFTIIITLSWFYLDFTTTLLRLYYDSTMVLRPYHNINSVTRPRFYHWITMTLSRLYRDFTMTLLWLYLRGRSRPGWADRTWSPSRSDWQYPGTIDDFTEQKPLLHIWGVEQQPEINYDCEQV